MYNMKYNVLIGKTGSRDKSVLYQDESAHTKSISSAGITPDGTCMVSVSHDDTVKLWEGDFTRKNDTITCTNVMRKNNHTGRWLSTFKLVFDPKLPRTFVIGSMDQPRRIEVYDIVKPKSSTKNNYTFLKSCSLLAEDLKSVCSRNAVHPSLNIVVGGNSSGRVHLFQ